MTRLFIPTEELLGSNNTTLASLQSTICYIEVYAILLPYAAKSEVTERPASKYYRNGWIYKISCQ